MIIPASRFSTLPEGCPVWRGETFGYWHTTKPTRQGELGWMDLTTTEPVDHEDLTVDLSTPAAVRAFAPELIAAVKERTRFTTPQRQPSAVWHAGFRRWILVDYLTSNDTVVAYEPTTGVSIGTTPEECLLNGLKAALDAAKDAQ